MLSVTLSASSFAPLEIQSNCCAAAAKLSCRRPTFAGAGAAGGARCSAASLAHPPRRRERRCRLRGPCLPAPSRGADTATEHPEEATTASGSSRRRDVPPAPRLRPRAAPAPGPPARRCPPPSAFPWRRRPGNRSRSPACGGGRPTPRSRAGGGPPRRAADGRTDGRTHAPGALGAVRTLRERLP